jgi:anthraniloyl-CoA monooxygenase
MKVLVAGAGPGGLVAASLLKAEWGPDCEIVVVERADEAASRGWGITLNQEVLEFEGHDPYWKLKCSRAVRGKDCIRSEGSQLGAVSRSELIRLAIDWVRSVGVQVVFGRDSATLSTQELDSYDLVIAADGAGSPLRGRFASEFGTTETPHPGRYIWLGTPKPLECMLMMLSEDFSLPAVAWAYQHSRTHSTIVAEMLESDWLAAGFQNLPLEHSVRRLESAFSEALERAPLLTQPGLGWGTFRSAKTAKVTHRNIALLGDAASTKHFSLGVGTFTAIADAEAIRDSLVETMGVQGALQRYEEKHRALSSELWERSWKLANRYVELLKIMGTGAHDIVRDRVHSGWLLRLDETA